MKSPLLNVQQEPPSKILFYSTVDRYELNEELAYGYRIFRELITQHKKCVLPIEENECKSGNKENLTFDRINRKFNSSTYKTITEVISDIRLVLQNCYRDYGADHYISKNAQTIELVVEQKLALIPKIFRDKSTIIASNNHWNKPHLNDLYTHRRRSQATETLLINQLRVEAEINEREKRKLREEARKQEYEHWKRKLAQFEEEKVTLEMIKQIKYSWELPCIGMYIFMLKEFMNIDDFNYTEFELASFFMDKSVLYAKIFTSLLATPSQRRSNKYKVLLTYDEWNVQLTQVLSKWFNMASKEEQEYTCYLYGFSKDLFDCLGEKNPMTESDFMSLSLKQRLTILKSLCESTLDSDDSMCACLGAVPMLQRQDLYLGQDNEKHNYYFFPQFGDTDIRVYKQYYHPKKKSAKDDNADLDYELVADNVQSLATLISIFSKLKKSKTSHLHDLQQTLEALYEELSKRNDSLMKSCERGKLAIVKDYYAYIEKQSVKADAVVDNNTNQLNECTQLSNGYNEVISDAGTISDNDSMELNKLDPSRQSNTVKTVSLFQNSKLNVNAPTFIPGIK